eukprot:CAMPEP_0184689840 /NCGR_PEP_ID=MMETSP0312-20130426/30882_1 /TAXON_ID=31354 /ORGANISM="Compsopogon coeruleus, Strain SAG 36.94" /LENGTH=78 /DNA_ID=CAMNT_0027147241 /DNA_START=593 /DNA_END=829 /DNA_ORIENTATION=-
MYGDLARRLGLHYWEFLEPNRTAFDAALPKHNVSTCEKVDECRTISKQLPVELSLSGPLGFLELLRRSIESWTRNCEV